ncbi:MAG: hypothetical protein PVG14_05170 [Anaerolineales bacterium]
MTDSIKTSKMPIKYDIETVQSLSIVVGILMGVMSLGGLILPEVVFTTDELVQAFVPTEVVNLIIGLPILFGSIWLTRRAKLVGLLLWPGALLYVLYNYIAYVFGRPYDLLAFVYLALVLLSAYTVFDLLRVIDKRSVQAHLDGVVSEKISGWVLIAFGMLFIFRAISVIAEASGSQITLPAFEISILIADSVLSVLMIAGGVLLLRRMPLGYVSGLGLLFSATTLFIGLIIFLLLQPLLTEAAFVLSDVIVVFIMGLICSIPFGLYMRGVVSSGKPA